MPIQQFVTLKQLVAILNESESTVRRRHAESLAGIGNFPRSVNAPGKKLLFRPEDIERWAGCQQRAPPEFESASQRTRRHNAALSALRARGVKVASKEEK